MWPNQIHLQVTFQTSIFLDLNCYNGGHFWCSMTNCQLGARCTVDFRYLQGKSKKFRVIESSSGSWKQRAGWKGKTSFYCTVNILITFNCRNVKLKWNGASRI